MERRKTQIDTTSRNLSFHMMSNRSNEIVIAIKRFRILDFSSRCLLSGVLGQLTSFSCASVYLPWLSSNTDFQAPKLTVLLFYYTEYR